MKVREAMISNPITMEANASVFEAARSMRDKRIGSVIVAAKGKVLGIATERDLVRRVLAEDKDPKTLNISAVMSAPVVSVSPEEDVVDAAQLMKAKGIRRLIVMDGERLVGIITADDMTRNMKRAVEELATTLYVMGREKGEARQRR